MDFKVAGTAEGVTAIQMDIKVKGITSEIMREALTQAREGRLFILGEMAQAIDKPRSELPDSRRESSVSRSTRRRSERSSAPAVR